MRLTELEPKFLRYGEEDATYTDHDGKEVKWRRQVYTLVEKIEEASGVSFLCPACFAKKGGKIGVHTIICWSRSRGVPDSASPGPGRWTLRGIGLNDLTLDGDPLGTARSVNAGCWHGHITNGEVTFC